MGPERGATQRTMASLTRANPLMCALSVVCKTRAFPVWTQTSRTTPVPCRGCAVWTT